MAKRDSQTYGSTQASAAVLPLAGILQRKCACGNHTVAGSQCEECTKGKTPQRKAINQNDGAELPAFDPEVLRGPAQPIDGASRSFFESRFGHDFSHVRVHTDRRSAESASAMNALAYTVGNDVVFGANQYAPGTLAGSRLLAHELTHVVQQQAAGSPAVQRSPLGPTDDPKERQADVVADSALKAAPEETAKRDPANPGKLSLKFPPRSAKPASQPVTITPPPQKVPAEVVKAATHAAKAEPHARPKVGMKGIFKGVYGGALKAHSQEGGVGTELGVELEREKKVSPGLGLAVGMGPSTFTVEGKLEGTIPVADFLWPQLHERMKRVTFVKQMKFGLGVGTVLGDTEKEGVAELAAELTINAFSLSGEVKTKRATLLGNLDVSGVAKVQGEPGKGAPLTLGGEISGGGKVLPGGGPMYVGLQLDFRLVSTYDGARWTGSFALTPIFSAGVSF